MRLTTIIKAVFLAIVPLVLLVLITTTSQAAETLLAQYYDNQGMFDGELEASMGNTFKHVFNPAPADLPPPYVHIVPVADGTTFTADAATVALAQACLTTSSCQVGFKTGNFYVSTALMTGDNFWVWDNQYEKQVTAYVPQLGVGFSGYRFTRITRTVSNVSYWIETSSSYPYGIYFYGHTHGTIAQSVKFYGEAIPEPSSLLLALLGCVAYLSRRSR